MLVVSLSEGGGTAVLAADYDASESVVIIYYMGAPRWSDINLSLFLFFLKRLKLASAKRKFQIIYQSNPLLFLILEETFYHQCSLYRCLRYLSSTFLLDIEGILCCSCSIQLYTTLKLKSLKKCCCFIWDFDNK